MIINVRTKSGEFYEVVDKPDCPYVEIIDHKYSGGISVVTKDNTVVRIAGDCVESFEYEKKQKDLTK